mmetsp:Transcript_2765/g.10639  ORF Transcript_2765/g.10639 Transcript_2765/m.10639 type:complete len:1059 (-) Transcript_2765:36-3212(-)
MKRIKDIDLDYNPSVPRGTTQTLPVHASAAQGATLDSGATKEERFKLLLQRIKEYTRKLYATVVDSDPDHHHHHHQLLPNPDDNTSPNKHSEQHNTFVRLRESPMYIENTKLKQYQIEGLNWLLRCYHSQINCILADEMGLGKTIQTISVLGYLKQFKKVREPHIIIVPKSVMRNWRKEIQRWCPILVPFLFHGDKEERVQMRQQLIAKNFDVLITSYEMAIIEQDTLKQIQWHYLVIDEAHRIKNEHSVLSQVIRLFNTKHCLLVTGTPLQNNLHELWALLNYLLPDLFDQSDDFDSWFDNTSSDPSTSQDGTASTIMEQLHKIMRPFMLRRLKSDVDNDIPPKKEIYVECGMSDMQRLWYKSLLSKDLDAIKGGRKMRLLNVVTQLRKCCDHPYLFQGAENGPPFVAGEHIVNNSGKLFLLDKLLKRLKEGDSRVLIFSQMTRMLDILEDYCFLRQYEYCRIDGQTSSEDRELYMEQFNKDGSSKFIFLLSTRAGGLGINLATADTVVLYDSDWNPQMDLQAQDRAHRIGQKKPVNIYRMITKGTVEEKIYQRAVKKLYLDAVVIQQGRLVEQNKSLSKNELYSMITFGAEEIFKGASSDSLEISDEQLEAILQRGEKRAQEIDQKYKEKCQNNLLNFSLKEDESLYEFEGLDYSTGPTKCIRLDGVSVNTNEDDIISLCGDLSPKITSIYFHPNGKSVILNVKTKSDSREIHEIISREGSKEDKNWKVKFVRKHGVIQQLEDLANSEKEAISAANGGTGKRRSARPLNSLAQSRPSTRNGQQLYPDYQFVDVESLEAFLKKEHDFKNEQAEIRKERRRIMKENKKLLPGQRMEPPDIPRGNGLSRKENKKKKELIAEGFTSWTQQDFDNFVACNAAYGRDSIDLIVSGVPGKKPDEVRRYYDTFWSRYTELENYETFMNRIEQGERVLQHIHESNDILKWKTKQKKNPWKDVSFFYLPIDRETQFNEFEDRYVFCCAALYGYGNWEQILMEAQHSWEFRFDFFLKTRSSEEIGQRVEELLSMVRREHKQWKLRKRKREGDLTGSGLGHAPKLQRR